MNDENPRIGYMTTQDGKKFQVCANCGTPLGDYFSYQDAANRVWRKQACTGCNQVIDMQGPFDGHGSANPVKFK